MKLYNRRQVLLVSFICIALLLSGCSFTTKANPIALSLPKPTGPYNIGMAELHLTDNKRPDPWVKGKKRELMISIWYPAKNGYTGKQVPYLRKQTASLNSEKMISFFQLESNQINLANVKTHAWVNAPVAGQQNRLPVILYSPGGSLSRTASTFLVEELASRGYIVVTVDHTYETAVEFPNNRLEKAAIPKFSKETLKKTFEVRNKDIRFILDQLTLLHKDQRSFRGQKLPSGLGKLLDVNKIGMFGHSAGGYTTANTMYTDQRIIAGINMDGSLGYEEKSGQVSFPAVSATLNRPFMLFDADDNHHLQAPSLKLMWSKLENWKLDLNLPNGEHFSFTDYMAFVPELEKQTKLSEQMIQQSIGTTKNSGQVIQSIRTYVTAFFDEHLQGKPQKLLDDPSADHPDVEFIQ